MSIQSEITLLQNTKDGLRTAIMEKGVVVSPDDLYSTYPTRISQITTTPGDKDSLFSDLIEANVLTSLSIPYGTSRIRWGAFENQNQLTSITIPSSVNEIDTRAFANTSLHSITIPSSVKSMGQFVFSDCTGLVTATFEDGASVGYETFKDCVSLANVRLPYGLRTIGDNVFNGCISLVNITIPDSVTTIGNAAFGNCSSLTSITIPSGVTNIGGSAFSDCYSLRSITCLSETPPAITNYLPFENTDNCAIYVPAESVDAYKTAQYWSAYASRILAIETGQWQTLWVVCDVDTDGCLNGWGTLTQEDTDPTSPTYQQRREIRGYDPITCLSTGTFVKVTDVADVDNNIYLIVDESEGIALNGLLINDTTSATDGINASGNYIPVTIVNERIKADCPVFFASVSYDPSSKRLETWQKDAAGNYGSPYLGRDGRTHDYFSWTDVNYGILPTSVNGGNNITFKDEASSSRYIDFDTASDKFKWLNNTTGGLNIALYKLSLD